jgi:hypothetical protein
MEQTVVLRVPHNNKDDDVVRGAASPSSGGGLRRRNTKTKTTSSVCPLLLRVLMVVAMAMVALWQEYRGLRNPSSSTPSNSMSYYDRTYHRYKDEPVDGTPSSSSDASSDAFTHKEEDTDPVATGRSPTLLPTPQPRRQGGDNNNDSVNKNNNSTIHPPIPPPQKSQQSLQQQQQQQQRYFVMYVGPPKTATTTIQAALVQLEQQHILEQDHYVYLGRRYREYLVRTVPYMFI